MSNVKSYYERRFISSPFGAPRSGGRSHRGVDFSHSTQTGTVPIPNLLPGKVVGKLAPANWHGFGYQITIESVWNGRTIRLSYAHLHRAAPQRVGQTVAAGAILGTEGRSGWTSGPCVHIELHNGSGYINPAPTIEAIRTGNGSSGGGSASSTVRARQDWLNKNRNERLTVDGIAGPLTQAAIKRYQTFLKQNWYYTGAIDGIWGPATEKSHKLHTGAPKPAPTGTLQGLRWTGIQRMLKSDFGYRGAIDNIPGSGTISAFQRFMNAKGYARKALGRNIAVDGKDGGETLAAAQQWLKDRWGYNGRIDRIRGAGTNAAWSRAEAANNRAYARIR